MRLLTRRSSGFSPHIPLRNGLTSDPSLPFAERKGIKMSFHFMQGAKSVCSGSSLAYKRLLHPLFCSSSLRNDHCFPNHPLPRERAAHLPWFLALPWYQLSSRPSSHRQHCRLRLPYFWIGLVHCMGRFSCMAYHQCPHFQIDLQTNDEVFAGEPMCCPSRKHPCPAGCVSHRMSTRASRWTKAHPVHDRFRLGLHHRVQCRHSRVRRPVPYSQGRSPRGYTVRLRSRHL